MQKLNFGHQKGTIDHIERGTELFKSQTSNVIDKLLERKETSKSNSRFDSPLEIYLPKVIPQLQSNYLYLIVLFGK